jgi:hypothetical protein
LPNRAVPKVTRFNRSFRLPSEDLMIERFDKLLKFSAPAVIAASWSPVAFNF